MRIFDPERLERKSTAPLIYSKFWKVRSDSDPEKSYTVGRTEDGRFGCNCVGWCRHYPRRDCRHITYVKAGMAEELDPLLRSMTLLTARAERGSLKPAVKSERRKPNAETIQNRSAHQVDEADVSKVRAVRLGHAACGRVSLEAEANHCPEQAGRSAQPDERLYSGLGEGI